MKRQQTNGTVSDRLLQDDFILTLSDNDDFPVSEIESSASEDISTKDSSSKNKKRKRQDNKVNGSKKKTRVAKEEQPSDTESEDEKGIQDGTIDPDFEFDLGGSIDADTTEDFLDGWGNSGMGSRVNGDKKGVDIDDIIARRAAKQNGTIGKKQAQEDILESDISEKEVEDTSGQSDSSSVVEALDFADDELLAADGFGANAISEDEDEGEEEAYDDTADSEVSDNDSVASPTAHPDDDMSENDSDSQSSVVDPEEDAKRVAFFAPQIENENKAKVTSFQDFSLSRPILRGLAGLSLSNPTPIQSRAIPVALRGLDVVGSAQTGSGKTAAFLLPILERLLYRPRKVPTTRVAILMPTRELAVQCYNVATALARYTDITFAQVVGGFSIREQEAILKKRPDVVIATPGRFIDHMRNTASFAVEDIEILVLDEADRMLEDGFADELDEIFKTIPKSRQTMLFSATMTDTVDKLVRVGMNRPVRLSVDAKRSTVSGLVQEFVRLRPGREQTRLATLCLLCTQYFTERTIVFFRQKKDAHRVRIVFGLLGIRAGELHGSMTQEQRISAVNSFRDGKTTHLMATDLASRGLDIKNVMSVINYEAPQSHEIYLHRVGRTARAGRSGRACTIAAEPDRKVVKAAVKAARLQGAKVVSRAVETIEVNTMDSKIEGFSSDIEEILQEEKEEKALAQTETQITRGENLVKHEAEIKSRPKRTWFESEREKQAAKDKGRAELNGVTFKGEKKKLSNKDKKRLDDRRERTDGRSWKKGKNSEQDAKMARKESKSKNKRAKGMKPKGKKR